MRSLFKTLAYLLSKPNIKEGDILKHYYNHICEKVYFDWRYGVWFIKLRSCKLPISSQLEQFYKRKYNESIYSNIRRK